MNRLKGMVAIGATVMASGCTGAAETAPAAQPPSPWEAAGLEAEVGKAPPFPEALEGWRLVGEWNTTPRAFNDQWTTGSGPEYIAFPATMNGCDTTRFLVRWRAINPDSEVLSGWISGEVADAIEPGQAGWMSLNGCQTPRWQLLSPAGSYLTDVTVDVQEWQAAP